jgi:serine/threonine-protein kinase
MNEPTWIGKTIGGRYQIEELLGQGGMSAVYKATDPNLRRAVAVKIIHSHLSTDQEFVRRFEEEAAAVAQLRHPNIIQVFDFSHEGAAYFIVFEYIPGESLQERLKRLNAANSHMAYQEATSIAAYVADALEFAHEQGLIHRDVKPANVMINVRRQPILMDFGIAKIVGGAQHTATGAVLGTARYMSPEQIRGQRIDARTDVYSLGAMLFEMVSGRPPFEADSAMTLMMMHVQDPVPDLGQLRPDVPLGLTAVIHKALEKEPANRFQTAAEMATALRATKSAAAAGAVPIISAAARPTKPTPESMSPTVAGPETTQDATAQKAAPNPLFKRLGIAGGVIALLALIIFAIFQITDPDDGNDPPEVMTQAAELGLVQATTEATEVAAKATATAVPPTNTAVPQPTATKTAQAVQSATLAPLPPTATPLPAVVINAITIEDGRYIADYETIGYEPSEDGLHMHFFFNTTTVENAGRPGAGPYQMVPHASPFTDFAVNDTPIGATQLCALVANPNHTIQVESGNCVDLPIPAAPTNTPAPSVQITSVTESDGRYLINFQTIGYTPALPGTHIHFFFNTVAPENAGVPGNGPWKLYGGPSPFTEYNVSDRPANAAYMCALIANPDHSIQLGTGNCANLP